MKKSLLILGFICLSSALASAKTLSCTSDESPMQLYVEINLDDAAATNKFSLKYNLADPYGPNTDTYIDTFNVDALDGSWVLSDSYLRGIELFEKPQWHAKVQLFEAESPVVLNCN